MAKMFTVKQGDDLVLSMIELINKRNALDLTNYSITAALYDIGVADSVTSFAVDILDQDYSKGRYNLSLTSAQTADLYDRLYCFDVKFTNNTTNKVHSSITHQLNVVSNYQRETFR